MGVGMEQRVSSQTSKVLPAGKPARRRNLPVASPRHAGGRRLTRRWAIG